MPNSTEIPVEELYGGDLDAAVHAEVFGKPSYIVTDDIPNRELEAGETDWVVWRPADAEEAANYPVEQRKAACNRYSSDIVAAQEAWDAADEVFVLVRNLDGTWTAGPAVGQPERPEPAFTSDGPAEAMSRAALKAVRGAD